MVFKLVTTDGEISTEEEMTLEAMQMFVGGYIEYAGNIICNEDGLRLNLQRNTLYPEFVGNIIIEGALRS